MELKMKKILLAGLGVIAVTKERAAKIVNELVEKGEITRTEASKMINELVSKGEKARGEIKDFIKDETRKLIKEAELVSRKDYEKLVKKVNMIEEKLKETEKV